LIDRATAAALALVLAAALPADVSAQAALYKLVGRDGRVAYSDAIPKGFDGQVTRIEIDAAPSPPPAAKPLAATPKPVEPGMAEKRRTSRNDLEGRLKAAEARVDAARAARAGADLAKQEEMQVVQRRGAPLRAGQAPPRANCFNAVDPGSQVLSLVCPVQVPGENFYERQRMLDEDLARAEEELREAERAYRRGRD
jgi:hypothetical protein